MSSQSEQAIASSSFSATERKNLAIIVEMIIPASEEHGLPGASDEKILAAIVQSAEPHRPALQEALAAFDEFTQNSESGREEAFRRMFPEEAAILQTLAAQNYYIDDRVMRSLGMEIRPPFPGGFSLHQGDWSVLDPVRRRAEFYRKTP